MNRTHYEITRPMDWQDRLILQACLWAALSDTPERRGLSIKPLKTRTGRFAQVSLGVANSEV